MGEKRAGSRIHLPFLWSQLRPHLWPFFGIFLLLMVEMGLTVLFPVPVKYILNNVMKGKPDTLHSVELFHWSFGTLSGAHALLLLAGLGLLIGIALTFTTWVEQIWTGRTAFHMIEKVRRNLFERIFTRKQAYLDSKKKVDLVGRVSGDTANLEAMLTNGLAAVMRDLPTIPVLLCSMFLVNFKLTLVFSFSLPVLYWIGHYYSARMRAAFKALRSRTITFEEESYEAMNSMAIAKGLNGEEKLRENLLNRTSQLNELSRTSLDAAMGLEASMEYAAHTVKAGFILIGCWAIFREQIGIGDLFQLMSYMALLNKHVNNLNKFISKYPKCHASILRLEEMNRELELHPEISGPLPFPAQSARAPEIAVRLQDVTVAFEEGRKILDCYSVGLPKARLVALVGPSGAGKSTFGRLLNRLLDPAGGHVEIGGINIRQYDIKNLRSLVRTLSQETFLISASVRDNLRLAVRRPMSDAEIMEALVRVNAESFVKALPDGLDTVIGEGGYQLSGGEAQRIHLARAFLDIESEILLFDEPTTGLDPVSAQTVIHSIKELSRKKTLVLWVTHRMQEVFSSDHVLFFRAKENPLFSTHEELFLKDREYRILMAEAAPGRRESGASAVIPLRKVPQELAGVHK